MTLLGNPLLLRAPPTAARKPIYEQIFSMAPIDLSWRRSNKIKAGKGEGKRAAGTGGRKGGCQLRKRTTANGRGETFQLPTRHRGPKLSDLNQGKRRGNSFIDLKLAGTLYITPYLVRSCFMSVRIRRDHPSFAPRYKSCILAQFSIVNRYGSCPNPSPKPIKKRSKLGSRE